MLSACLLFFLLVSQTKSISLQQARCQEPPISKHELFGNGNSWHIEQWSEDKDSSNGALSYIQRLGSNGGINFSGLLDINAPDAHYGQQYLKNRLLSGIYNAQGISLLIDPLSTTTSIPNLTLQLVTKCATYEAQLKAPVDIFDFKTCPQRMNVLFESFKRVSSLISDDSTQFKLEDVNGLGLYVRRPDSGTADSFSFLIDEISVYTK